MVERPPPTLALFLPSLLGGGAERAVLNLAAAFARRSHRVDLVVATAEGPYAAQVPEGVRLVDLGAGRVLASLPALARYLRRHRPAALLSAMDHANVVAVLARRLLAPGVGTRLAVCTHTSLRRATGSELRRARLIPFLAGRLYPWADAIVAVSDGVAEDLARTAGLRRERIAVIPNPVVTPDLAAKARAPLRHPWFEPGAPPVVLGVGRLEAVKDFPTLLRAFALLRAERPLRLMILGEGPERPALDGLARDLGVADDVALPGFTANPYAYMARSAAFALSSTWEGLPTALIEAMACGCPVVATDCPHGPAAILEGGRHGALVPVGSPADLAGALRRTLDAPPPAARLEARADAFGEDAVLGRYLDVLSAPAGAPVGTGDRRRDGAMAAAPEVDAA